MHFRTFFDKMLNCSHNQSKYITGTNPTHTQCCREETCEYYGQNGARKKTEGNKKWRTGCETC